MAVRCRWAERSDTDSICNALPLSALFVYFSGALFRQQHPHPRARSASVCRRPMFFVFLRLLYFSITITWQRAGEEHNSGASCATEIQRFPSNWTIEKLGNGVLSRFFLLVERPIKGPAEKKRNLITRLFIYANRFVPKVIAFKSFRKCKCREATLYTSFSIVDLSRCFELERILKF